MSLTSNESKYALISTPMSTVPPSRRTPAPPAERYAVMVPVSGRKPFAGSSVVIRHCSAAPLILITSCDRPRSARLSPEAMRIWACTRSTSVISSVTGCSTWIRGFISMKTCRPARCPSVSTKNSTVPAHEKLIDSAKRTASRHSASRNSVEMF